MPIHQQTIAPRASQNLFPNVASPQFILLHRIWGHFLTLFYSVRHFFSCFEPQWGHDSEAKGIFLPQFAHFFSPCLLSRILLVCSLANSSIFPHVGQMKTCIGKGSCWISTISPTINDHSPPTPPILKRSIL